VPCPLAKVGRKVLFAVTYFTCTDVGIRWHIIL
jgi:hypothetical protein